MKYMVTYTVIVDSEGSLTREEIEKEAANQLLTETISPAVDDITDEED